MAVQHRKPQCWDCDTICKAKWTAPPTTMGHEIIAPLIARE